MTPSELRDYVHRLSSEGENIESYIMDLALYSNGTITLSEMFGMPMRKIKLFQERLEDKRKKEAGSNGVEYL